MWFLLKMFLFTLCVQVQESDGVLKISLSLGGDWCIIVTPPPISCFVSSLIMPVLSNIPHLPLKYTTSVLNANSSQWWLKRFQVFLLPGRYPHFIFSYCTVRNSGTCLNGVYTGLDCTEPQEAEFPVAAFSTLLGQKNDLSSRVLKSS